MFFFYTLTFFPSVPEAGSSAFRLMAGAGASVGRTGFFRLTIPERSLTCVGSALVDEDEARSNVDEEDEGRTPARAVSGKGAVRRSSI